MSYAHNELVMVNNMHSSTYTQLYLGAGASDSE